ncbi:Homocysteine S-methyltransferase [Ceraceosorus guamensis]|uniref:Homocysteine S-methyltransferase n=1 Tax=Ceraceosorus guamensis TaxID=1522189 RepID=A0A316VYK1_9BASI|nr:Homocysteine S-methyltransferase [Ceraceosorus guamensis]PWN41341.1 Homocysteine S-methyltransferase [Ceraceosorus guamensis]
MGSVLEEYLRSRSGKQDASATPIAIIDGGLATRLETLGQDLSGSLWSAALLKDETLKGRSSRSSHENSQGCAVIAQAHLDFLRAGAEVIGTCKWVQLKRLETSLETFSRAGIDDTEGRRLMLRAIDVAQSARKAAGSTRAGRTCLPRPLIALSLGPYGASLSNGAEYTGSYPSPSDPSQELAYNQLVEFHRNRLEVFAASAQHWSLIDLIAFETIPRLDEIRAIKSALSQVWHRHKDEVSWSKKPCLFSCVFPEEGLRLPFPHGRRSETLCECRDILEASFSREKAEDWSGDAIGINCTKPHLIPLLVDRFTQAMKERRAAAIQREEKKHLFLYPDGGKVWDGQAREWKARAQPTGAALGNWAQQLLESAKLAIESGVWAGVWLGGCCNVGIDEIEALSLLVSREARSA